MVYSSVGLFTLLKWILRPTTALLMFAFGLLAISGIEDIPVLSYEAVMQHECKDSITCITCRRLCNHYFISMWSSVLVCVRCSSEISPSLWILIMSSWQRDTVRLLNRLTANWTVCMQWSTRDQWSSSDLWKIASTTTSSPNFQTNLAAVCRVSAALFTF